MFPLSRTKRIFTGLIITNLLLVAGFAGLYYVLNNRAQAANRLSAEAERIRSQNQREQALDSLIDSTEKQRNTIDSYFVGADTSAEFITLIESIASDTRVDLQIGSVSIESSDSDNSDDEANTAITEKLVMDLQASGSWDRVVHFTRVLELLPQNTAVTNISFERSTSNENGGSRQLWTVTGTIEAEKLISQ
jgi:uncharacterized membrane protein